MPLQLSPFIAFLLCKAWTGELTLRISSCVNHQAANPESAERTLALI
jgi:hypothetical protein